MSSVVRPAFGAFKGRRYPQHTTGERRARHDPLARLQIDLLEASSGRLPGAAHRADELLALIERQARGKAIGRGKAAEVAFRPFPRLSQETKLYCFAHGALAHGLRLNRYCVITFGSDVAAQLALTDRQPSAFVSGFIKTLLEPTFRRSGHRLAYFWNLEWHPEREVDPDQIPGVRARIEPGKGYDAFHVNLYLRVPPDLAEKVKRAFHRRVVAILRDPSLPVSFVTRKNANSPLHITEVRDDKTFSDTGFSGLLGAAEYGAKGLIKLRDIRSCTRLIGASRDARRAAEQYYDEHVARSIHEPRRVLDDLRASRAA